MRTFSVVKKKNSRKASVSKEKSMVGSPAIIRLNLAGLPKSQNQLLRRHWGFISRERNLWNSTIREALRYSRQIPKQPFKKAKLTLVRYSSSRPDYDGLVSGFKFVIDALVDCGVIEDDNWEAVGMPNFSWEKTPPKEGRITIQVEEIK